MDKNETLKLFNSVERSITYFRLQNDLLLIEEVIQNNQTTEVKSKWNVFGKASNKMKDNKANKFTEKKQDLIKVIKDFEKENSNTKYELYYSSTLKEAFDRLFMVDKTDLCKSFFAAAILLDDKYKYEFKNESIEALSELLYGDKTTIEKTLDKLNGFYADISNKWTGKLTNRYSAIFKEAVKNNLIYSNTENKKYLDSLVEDKYVAFNSNLVSYSLLFGKGVLQEIKIGEDSIDKLVNMQIDEFAYALSFYLFIITKARIKSKQAPFNTDLSLSISLINKLRELIIKELLLKKKNVKDNQEKLDFFRRFDESIIKEFNIN